MKYIAYVSLLLLAVVLFLGSVGLPHVGDPESAPSKHVSPRYIEKAYKETHSPNLVTAVLADYRGYDTLGETTVIFTAGVATVLILRTGRKKKMKGDGEK